jgi:TrmH family RNA methyltransferase
VLAALDAGVALNELFVAPGGDFAHLVARAEEAGCDAFEIAEDLFHTISDSVTPQPIIATLPFVDVELDALENTGTIVVAHDVRDPGNLGTLIRTADATGVSAVIVSGNCVDLYNPKTLRATAGSLFAVPVVVLDEIVALNAFAERAQYDIVATVVRGGEDLYDAQWSDRSLIVLGNEAAGLDDELLALSSRRLSIPMSGSAESLNVGVAGAIVLGEFMRLRRRGSRGAL